MNRPRPSFAPRLASSLAMLGLLVSSGCGAVRGSYFLADAEQKLHAAQEQGADQSIYYWTMAQEHMHKAYEEWGYSDFGAAEKLSTEAVDYANKAVDAAQGPDMKGLDDAAKQKVEPEIPPVTAPKDPTVDFDPGTEE